MFYDTYAPTQRARRASEIDLASRALERQTALIRSLYRDQLESKSAPRQFELKSSFASLKQTFSRLRLRLANAFSN